MRPAPGSASTLQAGTNDLGEGCVVDLHPGALSDVPLDALREQIPFAQQTVTVFGRTHLEPRLTSYHGLDPEDPKLVYTYSGSLRRPLPFPPLLTLIRARCLGIINTLGPLAGSSDLNTVLANLYENGSHGVGWHTDRDVRMYGPEPLIVSVSLGAARAFRMRARRGPARRYERLLGGGDVLVMRGRTQDRFVHGVPKTASDAVGPRLNLTFRTVIVQQRS